MNIGRVQVIVRDIVISGIGASGLIKQIFYTPEPSIELILLYLVIFMAPAPVAVWSLRTMTGGEGDTTGSSSSSSSAQPQQSSQQP